MHSRQGGLECLYLCAFLACHVLVRAILVCLWYFLQAMFLMAWRLTKLYEEGRMTHEQVKVEGLHVTCVRVLAKLSQGS